MIGHEVPSHHAKGIDGDHAKPFHVYPTYGLRPEQTAIGKPFLVQKQVCRPWVELQDEERHGQHEQTAYQVAQPFAVTCHEHAESGESQTGEQQQHGAGAAWTQGERKRGKRRGHHGMG